MGREGQSREGQGSKDGGGMQGQRGTGQTEGQGETRTDQQTTRTAERSLSYCITPPHPSHPPPSNKAGQQQRKYPVSKNLSQNLSIKILSLDFFLGIRYICYYE